jgi:hypothetical protein
MTPALPRPPWSPPKRNARRSLAEQIGRRFIASLPWHVSSALLACGRVMIKYQFVGSTGMRTIWRTADWIERLAKQVQP